MFFSYFSMETSFGIIVYAFVRHFQWVPAKYIFIDGEIQKKNKNYFWDKKNHI